LGAAVALVKVPAIMRAAPSRSGAALSPLRCLAQRMYRLRAPPQGAFCAVSMENPPATWCMTRVEWAPGKPHAFPRIRI